MHAWNIYVACYRLYTQSLTGLNASNDIGIMAIPTMPKAVPMLCRENPSPPAKSMYSYS